MLLAVAFGKGLQHEIREKMALPTGHISIGYFNNNRSGVALKPMNIHTDLQQNILDINGVTAIQPVTVKAGILRTAQDFEGVLFKGVTSGYNWEQLSKFITQGQLPDYTNKISTEILMSELLAKRLGYQLGDNAQVYFLKNESRFNIRNFKITGLFNSGYQDFDKGYVFTDMRHFIKMNKWESNQTGGYEVLVRDFEAIEAVNKKVYSQIPSVLDSTPITEKYAQVFQWLLLFDVNIRGIILIMIFIASVNMVTMILVLILEKKHFIGLFKVLGADTASIRKIFIYKAVYIIGKGLLWGNLIGLVAIGVQYSFKVITLNPENYYVNVAPVKLSFLYFMGLNIGTVLLCCVTLWLPTQLISRITPAKILRMD